MHAKNLSEEAGGILGSSEVQLTIVLEFVTPYERELDRKHYEQTTGPFMPFLRDNSVQCCRSHILATNRDGRLRVGMGTNLGRAFR